MKLNSKQLNNLLVITESNQQLGILESFNLETESQSILEYIVKPNNKIQELISGDLIIPRGQVIDITEKNIIVSDLFLKDKDKEGSKSKISEKIKQKISSPAVMKEK
jgi:sporulation protein YlmC with PRC-barrel domain